MSFFERIRYVFRILGAGFDRLLERPYVALFPAILDLWLWQGPQLSVEPLFREAAETIRTLSRQGVPSEGFPDPQLLLRLGAESNLFQALTGTAFPALGRLVPPPPPLWPRIRWTVQGPGAALLLFLGLFFLSFWLLGAYLLPLARGWELTPASRSPGRRLWSFGLRYLASQAILAAALGIFALPALAGIFLLALLVPQTVLMTLVALGAQVILLALLILFAFVPEAILLTDAGPLAALQQSFRVVTANFGLTLLFLLAAYLLLGGMTVIWEQLAASPWGYLAALLGNGVVSGGLTAASLLFFRERWRLLADGTVAPTPSPKEERRPELE